MTKRLEVAAAPAPLEEYAKHFDGLFGKSNQREGFRRYVEGLLLPSERHKTLTGLTNTEPMVGAQLAPSAAAAVVSLGVGLVGASGASRATPAAARGCDYRADGARGAGDR